MSGAAGRKQAGYSLVEILVAAGMFAIVCLAVLGVYRLALGTEGVTAQRTMLQDELQNGLKLFDREIGDATASLATSTSMSCAVLVPTFDGDGVPTGQNDAIGFVTVGSNVYQTVVPGPGSSRVAFADKRILTNLPDPYPSPGLFTYWKRTDGALVAALPADATIVRISLLQAADYGGRTQTVKLTQDIRMRNR